MTPLTIIIPTLNEAATLQSSLQALQPLRARGVQVVVVDGGSRDSTATIAKPLADLVLTAPRGRALQMNAGAAAARSEMLLFLHADTRLPMEADELTFKNIWGRFDVRIDSSSWMLKIVSTFINWRSRLSGIATGDQAIFVRRDAFEAVGGFDNIPLMEDIALSKKLKRLSRPTCLHEKVITSARRWEQYGVWRIIFLMWKLRAAYFLGADPKRLAKQYGYQPEPVQIAIMAKAPIAGLAKTRLIPALGAPAAARLQRQFTLQALATARQAQLGLVTLWCAPDTEHRFFLSLQKRCSVAMRGQVGANLGERMLHVFQQQCTQGPLIMIGTDCPALTAQHLQTAADHLIDGQDAVFIPAQDGGYVLIGLRQPNPALFEGIDWSTERVMGQTRERLSRLGLSWQELESLWDVDLPQDLARMNCLSVGIPIFKSD